MSRRYCPFFQLIGDHETARSIFFRLKMCFAGPVLAEAYAGAPQIVGLHSA